MSALSKMTEATEEVLELFRDGILASDVGPSLTCLECDTMVNWLRVHGEEDAAKAMLEAHCLEDDDGDNEEHVALRDQLNSVTARAEAQPNYDMKQPESHSQTHGADGCCLKRRVRPRAAWRGKAGIIIGSEYPHQQRALCLTDGGITEYVPWNEVKALDSVPWPNNQ